MTEAKFKYFDLKLVDPPFSSSLTNLIIDLDHLRKKKLRGSTNPLVFFQLKHLFHTLESIGSARIEGNNTTIAEYIETKLDQEEVGIKGTISENIKEIKNIEETMSFIEEFVKDSSIKRMFISEIHKRVVEGLSPPPKGEGDHTPGKYRIDNVGIKNSAHKPPESMMVNEYMESLIEFINKEDDAKYDLLKVAIAHHRFVWIHPFKNGNGRTVRLFTYAMLVKSGFNVHVGRILNPTAVFCNDRDKYYQYLAEADKGTDEGILTWCEFVLKGLKEEIEKIDKLLDYSFLSKEILLPSLHFALERKIITDIEYKILRKVVDKQVVQASDLKDIFPGKKAQEVSRQIRNLINKKMLISEEPGKRKYCIRFDNNYLLRGVMKSLGEKGFLPLKE